MKSSNPIVNRALAYVGQRMTSNEAGEYPTPDGVWLHKVGQMGNFKLLTRNDDVAAEFRNGAWYVSPGPEGKAARYVIRRNWKGTILGTVANAAAKVGDMVVYGGGPHVVVKDLGGGKYVLRSRSTGRSFAVTAPKGFEVLEPGSYALNAMCRQMCNSIKSSLVQQSKITKDFSIAKDKNTGRWIVLAGHWNPIRYCDTKERALDVAYSQQSDVDRLGSR